MCPIAFGFQPWDAAGRSPVPGFWGPWPSDSAASQLVQPIRLTTLFHYDPPQVGPDPLRR